jgi:hypothetical protein
MDTTKDEFNIPNIIVDPRTRTQYSKGKFLGKVRLNSIDLIIYIYLFLFISRVVSLDVMN